MAFAIFRKSLVGVLLITSSVFAQSPPAQNSAPPANAGAAAFQPKPTPAAKQTKKDDYNYLGFGPASSNASDSGERTVGRKKTGKARKSKNGLILVDPGADLSDRATNELAVPTDERSALELPTPATVRSNVGRVANPITRPTFEFGIMVTQFQPEGRIKLPGLNAYELNELGAKPMLGIEIAWLPIKYEEPRSLAFGAFAQGNYVQHNVSLKTPTGASIDATELHTMVGQLGGRAAWKPSLDSPWGAHTQLGYGQMSSVQSSSSSFANHASSVAFASFGLYGERRVYDRINVILGYEHRLPVRGEPEEIVLQRSNIFAGLSGGFQ